VSSKTVDPEHRLRNLRRRLNDLLLGHRLSAEAERTGVVELADFGRRCEQLADFATQSRIDLERGGGAERACARRVAEEVELAARLAGRLEVLPRSPERVERQCALLEEAARFVEAALRAECLLEEPAVSVALSALARRERELFEPLLSFEGEIADSAPGLVERGEVRRALRRALLEHEGSEPFRLTVDGAGVLRFRELEFRAEAVAEQVPRSPDEPAEVRRALDLREASDDEALRDFLLVKAVDEALFAYLAPRLREPQLSERARALPRKPGKRGTVRPEAVERPVPGWDAQEAARGADRLAARRLGPDWARLPKGAYVLRLFLSEDDALAEDLLALGPALRRMEKGEAVPGTADRAARALRGLLGRLG
jgi:hypothetical protein